MGVKRTGQLSRADLLSVLAKGDDELVAQIAQQMQLQYSGEAKEKPVLESSNTIVSGSGLGLSEVVGGSDRATAGFWRLDSRETFDILEEEELSTQELPNAEWAGRPTQSPKYELLQSVEQFYNQLLQPALKLSQTMGSKVDVAKLVRQLSEVRPLQGLPKKQQRVFKRHLHVIDDRHSHLIPYWTDQSIYRQVCVSTQSEGVTEAVLIEGRCWPSQFEEKQGFRTWEAPKNSNVVVLSDLGALSKQADQQVDTWLTIGDELAKNNCHAFVFLPCCPSLCDVRLSSYFTLIPLSNDVASSNKQYKNSVENLLTVLSPALRLEPGLVRQMRLSMARHGEHWKMGAEVEALLWQHEDIQETHSVAATWDKTSRLAKLAYFSQLPKQEKATALDVLKQWRQPLSSQVWFEEVISTDPESQLLHAVDVEAATVYFRQLSQVVQSGDILDTEVDTKEWLQRVAQRVPESAMDNEEVGIALQRIKHEVLPDDTSNIDPRNLPKSRNKTMSVLLYQQGMMLRVMPFVENYFPMTGCSPLAVMKMAGGFLQVKSGGREIGSLSASGDISVQLPTLAEKFSVLSDKEILNFELLKKDVWSAWATAIGRDKYGLYTDLALTSKTIQRFRWISAGTFQMGSPESEPERAYNEIQHQVTLTKGYWLADTTVTQAQWQAVTGESPSNFKGESLPVEEVSWSDSQKFIEMLRQDHPSIAFQLPSEAQWEYACRAGTATPFSFGEKITSEQANYDGNHPYDSGKKGEHRKTTVPVKSLPCNEWGLYEMHGNVEEWCNDSWQEKLVAGAVIDPESNEWSKLKVLRGGSWDIGGKYARSACRLHGSTYGTSSGSGLRLSFAPPSRNLGGGAAKTTNFKLKKENQVNLFIMCSQKDDVFKSALESRLRRVKQNYSLDFWSSTEFEKDGDVTSITHKDSTNADILILLISENSNTYKLFKSGIQQALKPFSDKIVIPIILDKSERWNNLNLSSMYLTPSEAIRESHDNISPVFWDEVEKSIELSVKNLLSKKSKPSNFA